LLVLEGVFDPKEYNELKSNFNSEIEKYFARTNLPSEFKYSFSEVKQMVCSSIEKLCDVSKLFIDANVSSNLINNGIQRNKKGQINELFDLPNQG